MQPYSLAPSEVEHFNAVDKFCLPSTLNTIYRDNLIYKRNVEQQVKRILSKKTTGLSTPTQSYLAYRNSRLVDDWDVQLTKDSSVENMQILHGNAKMEFERLT